MSTGETTMPHIYYRRGDTKPIPITILEGTVAIAGVASMRLTVNKEEEPENTDNQIDVMTGADGGGGVWSFTPTASATYPKGDFWYDIEVTYTDTTIETLGTGRFTIRMDLSK